MSNTIELLFKEHELITDVLDAAKQAGKLVGNNDRQYEITLREVLGFLRNYADDFHHHKEEQVLFPAMAKKNELLGGGVLKEMLDNHEDFREKLTEIEKFLDEKRYSEAMQLINVYSEALLDHIAVENDEVFQMAESLFTADELDKLSYEFEDADIELGSGKKLEFEELAETLKSNLHYSD